jgi:YebC/PmpR family DNA-binding regulatory protein
MAGHSKWNNIKNRKGAADEKRAQVFAQHSKHIRIAVKEGKSDNPQFNPSLRLALDKARAANMPKDKIQRALDRGMGRGAAGATIQEVTYEAFGPGGVALLINAVTDNLNRTSSEIKFALSRNGGSMAGPGSAKYMFQRSADGQGYTTTMPMDISDEDGEALLTLIDTLQEHDDVEDVFTNAKDLQETAEENT